MEFIKPIEEPTTVKDFDALDAECVPGTECKVIKDYEVKYYG